MTLSKFGPETCQGVSKRVSLQTEDPLRDTPFSGTLSRKIPGTLAFQIANCRLSTDCKRGRRKGATSKNVKNRQKVSKSFSTLFDNFCAGQKNVKNRQKASKSFSTLFDNFRAAPFYRPLLGGSEIEAFSIREFGSGVCVCVRVSVDLMSSPRNSEEGALEKSLGMCRKLSEIEFLLATNLLQFRAPFL